MLNFPDAPTVGQGFISGPTWSWDGVKWVAAGAVNVITVTATTILPAGTQGDVLIKNGTGAPITVTLPSGSLPGQALKLKDALGNASAHSITIAGAIDGSTNYQLMYDYASLDVVWMGSQWGAR
jgi:hypothetical protein